MHKHRQLTIRRLEKFKSYLRSLWYQDREPLGLAVYAAPDRIPFDQAIKGAFQPVKLGTRLAPPWSTHWFKLDFKTPAEWAGQEIHLIWDSSSEACIWQDGEPVQGLAGSGPYGHSPYHDTFPLTANATSGKEHRLHAPSDAMGLFDAGGPAAGEAGVWRIEIEGVCSGKTSA